MPAVNTTGIIYYETKTSPIIIMVKFFSIKFIFSE